MFGTLEHHPGAGGLGFKMLLHTFFFFKMEKHKDCMGTWGRQAGWLPADPPPQLHDTRWPQIFLRADPRRGE